MKAFKGLNIGQLSTTLRQPQWIAAILSIGFHGVLFTAGPSFSTLTMEGLEGGAPGDEQRRVPVIELTPEEQSRLPDFSSPAYSLTPGNNGDLFSLFPPSGSSVPFSAVPDFNPTPRPQFKPPSGSVAVGIAPYTLPPRTSITIPRPSGTPSGTPSGSARPEGVTLPRPGGTAANGAASTPTARVPDEYDGPTAADLIPQPGDVQANATPEPGSAPLDPNGETTAASPAEELIARVEYNPEQTTEAETEVAKEAWVGNVTEELQIELVEIEEPLEVTIPYEQGICLTPEPTDGLLGLVAVPGKEPNTLALSTTLLKSTGYAFLNQAAVQALQSLEEPSETGESALQPGALYQVVVKVDYDSENCISGESLLKSRGIDPEAVSTPQPTPPGVE
ncbi:MAG: hypothetical protein HC922_00060 [Leptolyngbyaceae cyanobacterium SM2_3_12]|nr:hypothetical protein [Leptolyngbyaceae cyanobacterium SM2_3_12]